MGDDDEWEQQRKLQRDADDADEVEWRAVREGSAPTGHALYDEELIGEIDERAGTVRTADDGGRSMVRRDLERDDRLVSAGDEYGRRGQVLGLQYPFEIDGGNAEHRPSDSYVYEFCLSLSVVRPAGGNDGNRYSVAFERLVATALSAFLGPQGAAARVGWPYEPSEPPAETFADRIGMLQGLCGTSHDWEWGPARGLPAQPSTQRMKDMGLDVVGWRPTPDGRRGNLYVLAQCATGRSELDKKTRDVNERELGAWVRSVSDVRPVRGFACPYHVVADTYLGELCRSGGVLFDRARLSFLAAADPARFAAPIPLGDGSATYRELTEELATRDLGGRVTEPEPSRPRRRPRRAAAGRRSRSRDSDS